MPIATDKMYILINKLQIQNVRFLFDGERLLESQTPADIGMENGDEIEVVIEQVGGFSRIIGNITY